MFAKDKQMLPTLCQIFPKHLLKSKKWGPLIEILSTRPFQLVTGRVWRGTAFGGYKSRDSVPKLVEEYLAGKLKLDEFVTGHRPLQGINEAFEDMHAGRALRTIIDL